MLQIDITGVESNGDLLFNVNGSPSSNGNSRVHKGEDVHWKVQTDAISGISDIKMKTGSGAPPSVNIFSSGPEPQGSSSPSQIWKGTVSSGVPYGSEYHYDIMWVEKLTGQTRTFDPKMSIYPSRNIIMALIVTMISFVVGLLFFFNLKKKKNR